MEPYEALGNAVVLQAVKDWRSARKRNDTRTIHECEAFFLSGRFSLFTDLDGEALLQKLSREG